MGPLALRRWAVLERHAGVVLLDSSGFTEAGGRFITLIIIIIIAVWLLVSFFYLPKVLTCVCVCFSLSGCVRKRPGSANVGGGWPPSAGGPRGARSRLFFCFSSGIWPLAPVLAGRPCPCLCTCTDFYKPVQWTQHLCSWSRQCSAFAVFCRDFVEKRFASLLTAARARLSGQNQADG